MARHSFQPMPWDQYWRMPPAPPVELPLLLSPKPAADGGGGASPSKVGKGASKPARRRKAQKNVVELRELRARLAGAPALVRLFTLRGAPATFGALLARQELGVCEFDEV